jgi:hypothetical protein
MGRRGFSGVSFVLLYKILSIIVVCSFLLGFRCCQLAVTLLYTKTAQSNIERSSNAATSHYLTYIYTLLPFLTFFPFVIPVRSNPASQFTSNNTSHHPRKAELLDMISYAREYETFFHLHRFARSHALCNTR